MKAWKGGLGWKEDEREKNEKASKQGRHDEGDKGESKDAIMTD